MSSSQKTGIVLLVLISFVYIYLAFFGKDFKLPDFNRKEIVSEYSPLDNNVTTSDEPKKDKAKLKNIRIFLLDKSGNLRGVNRECDTSIQNSCLEYALKELISSPTNWEKSKGFMSEIPAGTKLLSVRESANNTQIDLSSDFEAGGGAESTSIRVKQLIKTVNANSSVPAYLYINGKQVNVIGGEGLMLKQPLNDKSLES